MSLLRLLALLVAANSALWAGATGAGRSGGGAWVEICTALGTQLIELEGDESSSGPDHDDHCGFCEQGTQGPASVLAKAHAAAALRAHSPAPAAVGPAPPSRPAYLSRAPPREPRA